MPQTKKQQQHDSKPDTAENAREKNENRRDNNTGAVNAGNLVNSGRSKNTRELHTKNTVMGSDSDGQAD